MTSLPDQPAGPDLDALRKDIDELQQTPTEDLIEPAPAVLAENEPEPERTDSIGYENWDEQADAESTEV
ncbi:hypothetical protein [Microbacterium sp. SS28]|uniref:hypothetical protein n=1 Tax=Microbacterium sp. SS28 TaxID=2919948 RepID=UPI001FA9649D|nr:hypothetical protein [Microbacterium sp. SS28]